MSDQTLLDRSRTLTLGEAEKAARAMERIEAAGQRHRPDFWCVLQLAHDGVVVQLANCDGQATWRTVPWSAIRDDEQDPLEAAEQAAIRELNP